MPVLNENSDVFENGGSSLRVLQITGKIYDVLGVDVKLRHVFSYASPRSLSDFLENESKQGDSGADGISV
ncbi:phosphopantetheine-binding protein [Streptomyces sp. NPDC056224]|uniref:phosphopantetheine-binding protein n=1 Tax=Streptomyces sp. NPDC056224 TaxID=3345750 RepID=UPI0035D9D9A4